jgi:tRNA(fMet)-specific endonuclease VapC
VKSRYLLDTNILSEALKPNPAKNVIEELSRRDGEIATASIVVHEITFGCLRLPKNSKRRTDIQLYIDNVILAGLPIFDYNTSAALWHSDQRATLMAQGSTIIYGWADSIYCLC